MMVADDSWGRSRELRMEGGKSKRTRRRTDSREVWLVV